MTPPARNCHRSIFGTCNDDADGQGYISPASFDYDPAFGGSSGSNATGSYLFKADHTNRYLQTTLVWHLDINGGNYIQFNGAGILYNLDLVLYDLTDGGSPVANAKGTLENTETIMTVLIPDHDYLLQVTPGLGQGAFQWDYALAWIMRPDQDGDAIVDELDNCMRTANPGQQDTNGDGYGNICDADLNNDNFVDMIDFVFFKQQFSSQGPSDADFNSDNYVDMIDFVILKQRMNTSAPWY